MTEVSHKGIDPMSQDEIWKDLAVRAQAGDKKAYSQLLRDICPFIKRVLGSSLANPDWVDDISQEVLISVHKSLATYSPDRPFRPWIAAIVQFRRTDYLRKHYRNKKAADSAQQDVEIFGHNVTDVSHAGEFKDIEAAMASLPENQRILFEKMKIQGFTAKEIAAEMGMTDTAVKVSVHRTMSKLKDKLG